MMQVNIRGEHVMESSKLLELYRVLKKYRD